MIHVRDVEYLGGQRLALSFSDGTSGVADLSGHFSQGWLGELNDLAIFAKAYIEFGTVCWPGELDLAAEYLYALAHGMKPPKTFEEARRNQQAVTLRELRNIAGKTQVDVADEMGVAQGEISRLERREDAKLSTLRAYVEALGGKLDLVAHVGGRTVPLEAFLPTGRAAPARQPKRTPTRAAVGKPPKRRLKASKT